METHQCSHNYIKVQRATGMHEERMEQREGAQLTSSSVMATPARCSLLTCTWLADRATSRSQGTSELKWEEEVWSNKVVMQTHGQSRVLSGRGTSTLD